MANDPFPPKGYVLTQSTLTGITVYMPAPEIDDYETRVEFACPNCGGVQAYNVTDGGLACTSCGYYQPLESGRVGHRAKAEEFRTEQADKRKQQRIQEALGGAAAGSGAVAAAGLGTGLTAASAGGQPTPPSRPATSSTAESYDWGEERQELNCQNCGASILVDPKSLTLVCPFCGSSSVIQQQFAHDKLRPRYLIPFTVEDHQALAAIREWLGSSWMTPSDLQKRAGLDTLKGIYLPYWNFSATCTADWRAQVGHDRIETYTGSDGKMRTRTVTDWVWENGHVHLPIRDLLVAGTAKLNQRLLGEVERFRIDDLAEYDPSYLAGFNAQTYDVDRDSAWTSGRTIMREMTKKACYGQASTSKVRNFSMTLDFDDETWRYLLLPVYLTTYRYGEDIFSVMVNGQTGLVTGQRPVYWMKVLGAALATLLPGAIVVIASLFVQGDDAQNILIVGIVFLACALAFGAWLVWSALNIRKKGS